jgi:hypothetical protein
MKLDPEHNVLEDNTNIVMDLFKDVTPPEIELTPTEQIKKLAWEVEIYVGYKDHIWKTEKLYIEKKIPDSEWIDIISKVLSERSNSDQIEFYGIYNYPENYESEKIE